MLLANPQLSGTKIMGSKAINKRQGNLILYQYRVNLLIFIYMEDLKNLLMDQQYLNFWYHLQAVMGFCAKNLNQNLNRHVNKH